MPKDVWILDPGVTIHMIFQSEMFSPSRIDYIIYVMVLVLVLLSLGILSFNFILIKGCASFFTLFRYYICRQAKQYYHIKTS